MATQFTNYTKDGLLNHYFRITQWSNSGRNSIQVGLHTADPTAAGSDAALLTGIGKVSTSFGSATAGGIANDASITFSTTSSGDDGAVITHIAVYGNDGQMLCYGDATPNLTVSEGTDIVIPVAGLAVGVDTNSLGTPLNVNYAFTDARVVEFLDFVIGLGTVPAAPSAHYFCYVDTFDKDGSGSAWAGMNEAIAFDAPVAGTGTARKVQNTSAVDYVTTGAQSLGMWVVKDQAYSPIALKQLSGNAVVSGATVTMNANDLEVYVD